MAKRPTLTAFTNPATRAAALMAEPADMAAAAEPARQARNVADWGKVTMRVRPDAEKIINETFGRYLSEQPGAGGRMIRKSVTKQDFMMWLLDLGLAQLEHGPDANGRYHRQD